MTSAAALPSFADGTEEVVYLPEPLWQSNHQIEDSTNVRLTAGVGWVFTSSLVAGGTWGALEGLLRPTAVQSLKPLAQQTTFYLRLNSILNHCTMRGAMVAQPAGVLAFMYGALDYFTSAAYQAIKAESSEKKQEEPVLVPTTRATSMPVLKWAEAQERVALAATTGALTGLLFKSTRGLNVAARTGLLGAVLAGGLKAVHLNTRYDVQNE